MTKDIVEYQVRLRHVQGDLGPFTLPAETTVAELSELAYVEWPEDGPLSPSKPSATDEIKLISGGKFVEGSQTLGSIATSLGPLPPDVILTLHLIVRPHTATKSGSLKSGSGGGGTGAAASPRGAPTTGAHAQWQCCASCTIS